MIVNHQDRVYLGAILNFCVHSDGGLVGENIEADDFVLISEQKADWKVRILTNNKVLDNLYKR